MISVTDYFAKKNDPRAAVNNTLAFQTAHDNANQNDRELYIPPGTWYLGDKGDGVPALIFDGAKIRRVVCEGELVFTGAYGSVRITGAGLKVEGLNVKRPRTDARGSNWAHELFHLHNAVDCELIDTVSANSAASGLYIAGCNGISVTNHHSIGSYADGIHVTGGSKGVRVRHSTVTKPRDDYLAVVSPVETGPTGARVAVPVCEDIIYDDIVCRGQTKHGRGATVVGGKKVRYYDINMDFAAFAGILVASETSYGTHGCQDVSYVDITIGEVLGNEGQVSTGDGVHIHGRDGHLIRDVTLHGVNITKVKRHGVILFQNYIDAATIRRQVTVGQVGGQQLMLAA